MIRNILLALCAFIVLAVIGVWILNRGPQRTLEKVRTFSLTSATTSGTFVLPWQPTSLFPFIDDKDLFGDYAITNDDSYANPETQLADIERQYAEIVKNVKDVQTFGNPSPLFGSVRIVPVLSNTAGDSAKSEFIILETPPSNTSPVSLLGWSLQSALTGIRVALPDAASSLRSGDVNNTRAVSLNPGASAIVSSGVSPVGVSFRENLCIGYIAQFQQFYPALPLQCPTPSSDLPLTAENLRQYGDACFDFASTIPTCEFPQQVPDAVSPACRAFLRSTLSYNGCLDRHSSEYNFLQNTWRLYLGSERALWRNSHDAIRLLDSEGQTVDVYVY